MARRKATRKSRHGCLQCKRRSVKCDEKRPKCSKCDARLDVCQYGSSGPWLWTKPASAEHSSTTYPEVVFRTNSSPANDCLTEAVPQAVPSAGSASGDIDSLHLKLLMHWKTEAAPSISRNDSDLRIWQSVVPNEALSNPYLLYGILAVSAIHLAIVNPQGIESEQWIRTAEHYQSEAINFFTGDMEEKHQYQHIGNFVLSSLLIGFAFAFPLAVSGPGHEISDPLGEMTQIITLIKSTMNFSAPLLTDAKSDEMGQLTHVEEAAPGLLEVSRSAISALYGLNTTHDFNAVDRQAFHSAIYLLEDLFAHIDGGAEPVTKAFMWMNEIPSRFSDLLRERHPFALVVFAHYCVVLHQLRWLWWVSSWGQRVLLAINRALDQEWRPLINWPFDAIGIEDLEQRMSKNGIRS